MEGDLAFIWGPLCARLLNKLLALVVTANPHAGVINTTPQIRKLRLLKVK